MLYIRRELNALIQGVELAWSLGLEVLKWRWILWFRVNLVMGRGERNRKLLGLLYWGNQTLPRNWHMRIGHYFREANRVTNKM